MAGLQGSGKTTTSGKLARLLVDDEEEGRRWSPADVYRPAAIEQLKTVAGAGRRRLLPSAIGREAGRHRARGARVRAHALHRRAHRRHRGPPRDRRGDDGGDRRAARRRSSRSRRCSWSTRCRARTRSTSRAPSTSALPLTGVILTKLDGDARGGAALSVRHVTGKPIKFAGVGEKLDGLEPFHPERMAARILGMGDILSLVEEAHAKIDLRGGADARREGEEGQGLRPRGLQAADRADEEDGRRRPRSWTSCPRSSSARSTRRKLQDEKQFKRIEGIINSMTPQERAQARAHQGLAQAPHRRRRRRAGAGGEPAAQPVRADAEDDEDDEGRQPAAHDAQHEGHAARR